MTDTAAIRRKKQVARLGRADRSPLGLWFWEIDRVLLMLITVLISIGLVAVAAASPAAGSRYSGGGVSFTPLHYFYRQLVWTVVAVPVLIGVSMLPKSTARRFSIAGTRNSIAVNRIAPSIDSRRAVGFGSIDTPISTGTAAAVQISWR